MCRCSHCTANTTTHKEKEREKKKREKREREREREREEGFQREKKAYLKSAFSAPRICTVEAGYLARFVRLPA